MASAGAHILIVEDEPKIAAALRDYLQSSGFVTSWLDRGDEVERWLATHTADLLVLDLMLPGLDGLELCKRLRARTDLPIVIVTARVEEIDRLLGLELGADDYICKPFSPREVVARVKAILRRQCGGQAPGFERGRIPTAQDSRERTRAHIHTPSADGRDVPGHAHRGGAHRRQPHQETAQENRKSRP